MNYRMSGTRPPTRLKEQLRLSKFTVLELWSRAMCRKNAPDHWR